VSSPLVNACSEPLVIAWAVLNETPLGMGTTPCATRCAFAWSPSARRLGSPAAMSLWGRARSRGW
jgi:hypothetical protein